MVVESRTDTPAEDEPLTAADSPLETSPAGSSATESSATESSTAEPSPDVILVPGVEPPTDTELPTLPGASRRS